MFDPITIGACLTTASTAFSGLKRAFQAGRDIESMTGDLSRWMSAVSDIEQKEKQAKNPPIFRKVFGSVEQEALEAFAAKKKLEEQRYELKTFIQFSHGHKAWEELIAMEGKIRKARQEQLYRQQEIKERIIEGIFIFILLCTIVGFGWLVWYLKSIQEQNMEISMWMFWNIILTLVIAPAVWAFRGLIQEVKRIDILLNKTREEYATRKELRDDLTQVMDALHRLEDKLDKVLSKDQIDGKENDSNRSCS